MKCDNLLEQNRGLHSHISHSIEVNEHFFVVKNALEAPGLFENSHLFQLSIIFLFILPTGGSGNRTLFDGGSEKLEFSKLILVGQVLI